MEGWKSILEESLLLPAKLYTLWDVGKVLSTGAKTLQINSLGKGLKGQSDLTEINLSYFTQIFKNLKFFKSTLS